MKRHIRLTDLHQITQILYDQSTGKIHLWTEYDHKHRRLLPNLVNNNVGNEYGFTFVRHLIETVTGRAFIQSGEENTFYREDTEEGRMLIQASITHPHKANA